MPTTLEDLSAPELDSSGAPLPEVSFIIPLYNQLPLTRAMLDSLLATLPPQLRFEVILIDDGSVDGTREWLRTLEDARLRPLLNERNLGYATSNNRAARKARAPLLALLNNDLLLRPGWYEPMHAALLDPSLKAGIVGNLQFRTLDEKLDHAGIEATQLGKLEHRRSLPKTVNGAYPCLAITGACCLLRREDFLAVGGFDEAFVNGGEDVDLCLKLRERGLASLVATGSAVRHHVSITRGQVSERDEKNSRLLYSRWKPLLLEAIEQAWRLELANTRPPHEHTLNPQTHAPSASLTALQTRAHLLARSAFWRETARWDSLIDGKLVPLDGGLAYSGFRYITRAESPFIPLLGRVLLPAGLPLATLLLEVSRKRGLPSLLFKTLRIGLFVSINEIQEAEWEDLPPGRHSLAIDAPASLPDRRTTLKLRTLCVIPGWPRLSRLLAPLLRTQLRLLCINADHRMKIDLAPAKTMQTRA